MKNKLLLTSCLAALICSTAFATSPAPMKKAPPAPSPKATASPAATTVTDTRAIPFHGMISAVDQKAKTFTIAGKESSRVFKITDKTVLTKGSAKATMKDVVANEEVRGSYWKAADGSLEAKTVKLGPATDAEKTKAPKPSASASPAASPKP